MPTPIGNLGDISARCLDILELANIVICEDTRVAKSLYNLLKISPKNKKFYCLNSHNSDEFCAKFTNLKEILNEQICAYLSDAGMPGISDPGEFLVNFAKNNNIEYFVLPGANAALLAAVASGLIKKEFIFLGFLPNTGKERELALQNALSLAYPAIIYESPKRILKLVENIANIDENREIFAIKEATKKFEKKFFGRAIEVFQILKNANLQGEWTLIIKNTKEQNTQNLSPKDILALDIAPKIKAKLLSKITGENAKKIYENLINKAKF